MTSKKTAPRPVTAAPRTPAIAVVEQRPAVKATQRHGFKTNEYIVYPAHGVGQILSIEEQEVAGYKLELFVINFIKDKMTLRVPVSKIATVGMRKLSEGGLVKRALETLKGRARVKRTMWSRRAQEYEAKINSGDIVAIAEVVRDLFRSDTQPEQSYSERQLYEAALEGLLLFVVLGLLVRSGALKRPGLIIGAFAIGYALTRSFAELFREPDAQLGFLWGGLTMGMLLSLPLMLAGIGFILVARRAEPLGQT